MWAKRESFPWSTCVAVLMLCLLALPGRAMDLLRDADVEYGLKQLATPVLRAAGLNPNRVKILVVDDGALNAFVVSNDAIFIHAGMIERLTSGAALQGVIAHEAAHIANGHLARRMTNMRAARSAAGLGMALAAAAAVAGSPEAATGIAAGTSSSALRGFLRHTRAEEASADQSAVRYLKAAGISTGGLRDVMRLFRGQEALAETRQDPYLRTHPLSRDRLRQIEANAGQADTRDGPEARYWFARVKGKLSAERRSPRWTMTRAGESGYADVKLIREAVAHSKQSNTRKALAAVDRAIGAQPNDPFLHGLRGDILMRAREFGAAAGAYGRAVQINPNDAILLSGLGRAYLAAGDVGRALPALERSRAIDWRDGHMMRDLATAYAKSGQRGMASVITAERYALRGDFDTAAIHAQRASGLLPEGSGGWKRAQDVLVAAQRITGRN